MGNETCKNGIIKIDFQNYLHTASSMSRDRTIKHTHNHIFIVYASPMDMSCVFVLLLLLVFSILT